jgi:hypothetical protein
LPARLPLTASNRQPPAQIDLSDDMVVAQLFGNGAWQDVMQPLQVGAVGKCVWQYG